MNPTDKFPDAAPKFMDNGSGAKLLQPDNQVPYAADGDADLAVKCRDALITAGIMRPAQ